MEYGNPSRCLEVRLDLLRLPCLKREISASRSAPPWSVRSLEV